MANKLEANAPLIVAGLAVVGALVAYSRAGSSTAIGATVIPGTDHSAERNQVNSTNAALAQAHEATVFAGFGKLIDFADHSAQYDNALAIEREKNALASFQTREAALVANHSADDALAAIQAKISGDVTQNQTNASQKKQGSFWSGLFGAASTIFGGH